MQKQHQSFKVCLIGASQSGKSEFLRQLLGEKTVEGKEIKGYVPTEGCAFRDMMFNTNHGSYKIMFWDVGAHPGHLGLGDMYYFGSQGALAFYSHEDDCEKTNAIVKDYKRVSVETPIVNVWQSTKRRLFSNKFLEYRRTFNVDTSDRTTIITPILNLLRVLTGKDDLVLV